jgi:hypothetical protein
LAEHQKKCKLFNFHCLGSGYFKSQGATKVANIVQLGDNINSIELREFIPWPGGGGGGRKNTLRISLEYCNAWKVKGKAFKKGQKQAI